MRRLFFISWLPIIALLANGCVTHKLWTESKMDEWNEPAANPNLRLFHDEKRDDFLVVYDEYSNRHDTTQARAYFLAKNQKPLAQHCRPNFVSTNSIRHLPAVPVVGLAPASSSNLFYAVATTNGGSFTIFSGGQPSGPHALPAYNDGVGRWERIAWTPLTVTADTTIIGGVLVLMCWEDLGESKYSTGIR